MQGRATIVIGHRFSTIRKASVIHVMQDGKVVAIGTHPELVSDSESLYAHLYRLQYQKGTIWLYMITENESSIRVSPD